MKTLAGACALAMVLAAAGCDRRVLGVDDPGRGDAGGDAAAEVSDVGALDLASGDIGSPDLATDRFDAALDATSDAILDAADATPDMATPDTSAERPTDADTCAPVALPEPIVHFTFDDCTDDLTAKLKDSAVDGPADGTRGPNTRCVLGRSGRALYFDGQVGAEVTVPVRASFAIERVTVAAWVRPSHASDTAIIGRWFVHDQWALGFDSIEQKIMFSVAVPSPTSEWGDPFRVGMAARDDTWVHVAASFDGTFLRIYENGRLAGETRITDAPRRLQDTTKPLAMGYVPKAPPSTDPRFRGDLDDVRVYGVALTAAQIARLACGP
jgi:hypothetical protein